MAANPVEPGLALPKPPRPSPEPSPEPCWTWPGSAPKPSRNLLWNLLQNPVEPDPAASHIFSGTFSGTLLNLTWLCTKPSPTPRLPGTFSGTFSGTLLQRAWPTEASQTFSGTCGTFSGTLLNLTRCLHQCTPELFWAEDPISRGLERTLNFGVGSKNWPVWNVRAAVANDRIQISCLNSSNYLGCFMFYLSFQMQLQKLKCFHGNWRIPAWISRSNFWTWTMHGCNAGT